MSDEEVAGRGRKLKSLPGGAFRNTPARVQELTTDDLNELARVATGGGTPRGAVAELTADDIKSLEQAFQRAKIEAADALARRAKGENISAEEEEIFWGWSCCCTTPCCCCAAADVDPFA
jgi:hypothetical protein